MPVERVRLRRHDWKSLWRTVVWNHDCRLCVERAETAHHLVPRNDGGDDVAENLMELCGDYTRGCHGDIEHWSTDTRRKVREHMTGAEIEYVTKKKGDAWLQRNYPL